MTSSLKAWMPYQPYDVWTVVTYGGLSYQVLQAKTSIPVWDPADAVTLWAPVTSGAKVAGAAKTAASVPAP